MLPCGTFNTKYEQELDFIRTKWQKFLLLLLFISLLTIPTFFASADILVFLVSLGSTIIIMTSMNILMGYAGIISIAVVAFAAMGGYTSAILANELHFPFLASLFGAGLVTAIVGTLVCLPALKVRGFGVAGVTLAIHFAILWVINRGGDLTGGPHGINLPYASIGGWVLDGDAEYYAFTVVLVFLLLLAAKNLMRSYIGRAFVALRDNDIASEVMGINLFNYKALAFFLSAFYAGIGGSVWAYYIMRIAPVNYHMFDTVWYMGFLLVGGAGSIMGGVFGSIAWRGLERFVLGLVPVFSQYFPGVTVDFFPNVAVILFGLVVMLFLILKPRGLNLEWSKLKIFYRLWPFSY